MSDENKKQEQPAASPASEQRGATIDGAAAAPGSEAKEKAPVTIKVIGVGGGAINAVNHMYSQHIKGVSFAVISPDPDVLINSPVPNRVLIGANMMCSDGTIIARRPEEASASAPEPVKSNVKKQKKAGWFSKLLRTLGLTTS